ncbi:glutathione S-transferase [Acidihalobacter ferrooxydans]|uniref:glutathione S-transferase n=1 Tax=Acidihalobacter ferrooxydans TaxID=1765967 RepID=UPI00214FBB02|nr:glutathione S-transferase [Acidihalobacter ferrooxydans]
MVASRLAVPAPAPTAVQGAPHRARSPVYRGQAQGAFALSSGRVPVLIDGNLRVWDSLAICEYVSERYLGGRGWPSDPQARAVARAVCAQMHADFTCLRRHLPMNLRGEFSWRHVSHAAEADIAQIIALWHACHTAYGQGKPWLFGHFTIADAFFAPVAARFLTYSVPLPPEAARYVDALRSLPAMDAWYAAARNERWRLPQYEALETWLAACPAK